MLIIKTTFKHETSQPPCRLPWLLLLSGVLTSCPINPSVLAETCTTQITALHQTYPNQLSIKNVSHPLFHRVKLHVFKVYVQGPSVYSVMPHVCSFDKVLQIQSRPNKRNG